MASSAVISIKVGTAPKMHLLLLARHPVRQRNTSVFLTRQPVDRRNGNGPI